MRQHTLHKGNEVQRRLWCVGLRGRYGVHRVDTVNQRDGDVERGEVVVKRAGEVGGVWVGEEVEWGRHL